MPSGSSKSVIRLCSAPYSKYMYACVVLWQAALSGYFRSYTKRTLKNSSVIQHVEMSKGGQVPTWPDKRYATVLQRTKTTSDNCTEYFNPATIKYHAEYTVDLAYTACQCFHQTDNNKYIIFISEVQRTSGTEIHPHNILCTTNVAAAFTPFLVYKTVASKCSQNTSTGHTMLAYDCS